MNKVPSNLNYENNKARHAADYGKDYYKDNQFTGRCVI